MLEVILTSDYEIHGNGQGAPRELMVEPTSRMAAQLDRHGAKLTVMADTVEILRFRRHAEETGSDDFSSAAIEAQLRELVAAGHDVQLHLHPAYANAAPSGDGWALDFSEYDLSSLGPERVDELVSEGVTYLERLLRPVDPRYACIAFRAANWSMQPSAAIVPALLDNGIRIDTSVFKWGRRAGMVRFDYAHAHDALVPWIADSEDVCRADPAGELLEIPIYCEHRRLHAFASLNRLYRAAQTRRHPLPAPAGGPAPATPASRRSPVRRALRLLGDRHAWKLDFNQCSGRQLIGGLERAARRAEALDRAVPLVLIGHSKLFTAVNERQLEPFLAHVAARPDRFRFATLQDAWATHQAGLLAA